MAITMLTANLLREMFANGYRNLKRNQDTVDALNVFPVPDGDTGTNMSMTLGGGVSAAAEGEHAGEMMKIFSRGSLLGARGNSGVILSQFIRGISENLYENNVRELSVEAFRAAMVSGVNSAYKAVITPVEGTILTVMREASELVPATDDFEAYLPEVIATMKKTLAKTPDLLPVLKEANVVDSGGAGLICIFEGMEMALRGETVDAADKLDSLSFSTSAAATFGPDSVLEYGYCTEFILQLMNYKTDIANFKIQTFVDFFETIGNSIVAVQDTDLVKVHVHTFEPETVLAFARKYGEFVTIKIENMSIQHNEVMAAKPKHQKYAIVAVTSGAGVANYFREMGTDVIIEGGQTSNPSTEDFIDAFGKVDADYIVVLPNNSNIYMAAQQAAELYGSADVRVIKTKSIAQGYSCVSMMDKDLGTIEELLEAMTEFMGNVTTGYVTTSIRDAKINDVEMKKGDYIGLDDETIRSACSNKIDAAIELMKAVPEIEYKEVLNVFAGKDVSEAELEELQNRVAEEFPAFECAYIDGGQEVYSFIFSLE